MNTMDLLMVALGCGVLARALASYRPKMLPKVGLAAQGVLGVYTAMMLHTVSLDALGSHWPIVIGVAVGTLALSVAGGALLGLHRGISPLTGGLSLVAGGSSGLVAIARELGGDDRVVAAVQYFRVALITAAMPFVVSVFYHRSETHQVMQGETNFLPWYLGMPAIAAIIVVGATAARSVRLPGAGLLGPMAITIVLEITRVTERVEVPMLLVQAAIMLVVWQSVLGITRDSLRAIKRILPSAFALIMVLNLASAGLGVVLAKQAGLTMLDGYLATSPGGVYAVLGTAVGSGSNVTFVMASQVIRIVLMLFAAPFVARLFLRFTPESAEVSAAGSELVDADA